MIKTSPSMTPGGLPRPPSFGSKPRAFPGGTTTSDTFRGSNNPALNKATSAGSKMLSRFFTRNSKGEAGAIEVAYFASSNIVMGAYDFSSKVLRVTFKGKRGAGAIYAYYNVPKEVWNAMKGASSVGRFHYYGVRKSYYYKRMR